MYLEIILIQLHLYNNRDVILSLVHKGVSSFVA